MRKRLGVGALLLTCCSWSFAGCAGLLEPGADRPQWRSRPSGALQLDYQRNLRAYNRSQGEPYELSEVEVDPAHLRLFVGSSDRGLYALRAQDGSTLWRFETTGPVQSAPRYDASEDVVYFGSNDGALYKVRAATGQLLWRFATNAEVLKPVELAQGNVYFVNANDTILCLDAKTGERKWHHHRSPALGMAISKHSGILLQEGRVHVAYSDGVVMAYAADTGREVWDPVDLAAEAEVALGEVPKHLDVDTTPISALVDGAPAVIAASYAGGVYALDASTGNQLWANTGVASTTDLTLWEQAEHRQLDGDRFPARRVLMAATGTSGLWGLDPDTGEELWRKKLPEGGVNAPTFLSGAMLVSTTKQGLFLMSPLDGAVIDGVQSDTGFSAPATGYGARAFVISNAGRLIALSVSPPN